MNKAGLRHTMGLNDVYVMEEGKIVFKCYTAFEDAEKVKLYYTDKYLNMYGIDSMHDIDMEKVGSVGAFDVYEVELEIEALTVKYFFEIIDNVGNKAYLSEEGGKSEAVTELYEMFDVSQVARNQEIFNIPNWMKDGIVYQIFPERFNRTGDVEAEVDGLDSWYGDVSWKSRLGGTLKGIIQKMDYIKSLGVTILYLNPIFTSGSNHKYDTKDYYEIDPDFGTKEDFKQLVEVAHKHGLKVVIDGVFNHCGYDFWAFKDVLEHGEKSEYKDWFYIRSFPVNNGHKDGERSKPTYDTFGYFGGMPKLNLSNNNVKEYILDITKYWTKEFNVDGWRLDAADEISHDFWRVFRDTVKQINPEVGIIGEIWYDSSNWLLGDQYDSVMNYKFRKPVTDFIALGKIQPSRFDKQIQFTRAQYKRPTQLGLWNLLGSHDTDRILTLCGDDRRKSKLAALLQYTLMGNPVIYYGDEVGMSGGDDPDCRRGMYWKDSLQDRELLTFYRQLANLRKLNKELIYGTYKAVYIDDENGCLAFIRRFEDEELLVIINNSDQEIAVKQVVPKGYKNIELISGQQFMGIMKPYEGVIIK